MKKSAKIVLAATTVVMAGTLTFGMFGCDGCNNGSTVAQTNAKNIISALEGTDNTLSAYSNVRSGAWTKSKTYYSSVIKGSSSVSTTGKQEKYTVTTDSKGYVTDANVSSVELNINIGDASNRSISFGYGELLSGTVVLPDGNSYTSSSLKPAWAAFQNMVGCKFKDVWQNKSDKLKTADSATSNTGKLSNQDIITDSAANVSTYKDKLLDISNYLDYMPNYKAFLNANPIVQLSLTSDTTTGAMYYVPYFDGNNDIEKYVLTKTNWVTSLLDAETGDSNTTYKTAVEAKSTDTDAKDGTSSHITSYMGTTGKYTTTAVTSDGSSTTKIVVNYDAALTAAKDTGTDLGAAIKDAAGKKYNEASGNIVDLMNFAINETKGEVTGAQLLKIVQTYMDTAYQKEDGSKFYTTRSNVFNGNDAAWDVDLYAAVGRCLVTNPSLLKSGSKGNTIGGENATPLSNLFLICARQNNMQRMIDTVSLVGELYGVRGLESKNLYSSIDATGTLLDARLDEDSYDAMKAFNGFWEEGLVYTGSSGSNGDQSYYAEGTPEALTTYDYVNTQTPAGFQLAGQSSTSYALEEGYNYTPIITPVSKWDEDASGTIEEDEYFRFTESWRTTKDTGFCIPVDNVKSNPDKLAAVLKFIDCMFSSDGQILLTYGPMKNDKYITQESKNGWWSNSEATEAQIAAGTYFEYEGTKYYSETYYNGSYQPTITDDVMQAYYGKKINNATFDGKMVKKYFGGSSYKPGDGATKYAKGDALSAKVIKADADDGTKWVDDKTITEAPVDDCYVVNGYLVDADGNLLNKSGAKVQDSSVAAWNTSATLNYTNFARYVIGSALPVGNKLQSFEFQLTSTMGRTGALVVDNAIKLGVVKHTENDITNNPFYTVVPTVLPYTDSELTDLKGKYKNYYLSDKDTPFTNNKNATTNLYWQIIINGYDMEALNDNTWNLTFAEAE